MGVLAGVWLELLLQKGGGGAGATPVLGKRDSAGEGDDLPRVTPVLLTRAGEVALKPPSIFLKARGVQRVIQ